MTPYRSAFAAVFLFAGICLMLGTLGAMLILSGKVLAIYSVAVCAFAGWISWNTYQASQAGPDDSRARRT
jgi:positive regulator of sigma E activity